MPARPILIFGAATIAPAGAFHDSSTNSFLKCTPSSLTFLSNLANGNIRGLISTMVLSSQFGLSILSYSFGQLTRSVCRGIFESETGIFNQRQSPNQWCILTHNEPGSPILTFFPWPWMSLITWPRFFLWSRGPPGSRDPGNTTDLRFTILKMPLYQVHVKVKNEKCAFLWFLYLVSTDGLVLHSSQGERGNWRISRFPLMPECLF